MFSFGGGYPFQLISLSFNPVCGFDSSQNLSCESLSIHLCSLFSLLNFFFAILQYELKELKRRQEDDERLRAEELAAQQAALASLHSPPEGSHHDQYVKLLVFSPHLLLYS